MLLTSLCVLILSNVISCVDGNVNNDGNGVRPEDNTMKHEGQDNIQGIHCNCDIVRNKQINDLEHKISRQFKRLEYRIQHSLEEYIDHKLNGLQRNIIQKLEDNINYKFDTLKYNIEDLQENIISKFENALTKNEPVLDEKIGETIPGREAINASDDALKKKVYYESSINEKSDRFMMTTLDTKLKVLSRKVNIITYKLEEKEDRRLYPLNSSIPDLERSLIPILDRMEIKLADIQNNITQKCMNTRDKERLCIKTQYMRCKEFSDRDFGVHRLDDLPLNYTTLKRNSTGHLTYFKMHLAVKGDGNSIIQLSMAETVENYKTYSIVLAGEAEKQYTALKSNTLYPMLIVETLNIVSYTEFRTFCITIDNGTLEFGKEGDAPIISYENPVFNSINYIRLYSVRGRSPTKFLYDCPYCDLFI